MTPAVLAAYLLLFPGVLFLIGLAFFAEWFDRKLTARMQNRMGPPLFQPFADFIKLLSKEDIVPHGVGVRLSAALPIVALAAIATAFVYLPSIAMSSPVGFSGDLVLVLYLLTVPTIVLFLIGWTSNNVFARVGAVRSATQLFVYEVPFFLALLGPALAFDTWSIDALVAAQATEIWAVVLQPIGFVVALVALQAKLERVPFDIPEAETEIVAGPLTELTGRKLGIWHLARDMELVTGAALLATLFLGGPSVPGVPLSGVVGASIGLAAFLAKILLILLVLAAVKASVGRIRIDQLVAWGWAVLAPLALAQLAVVIAFKGWGWP